MTLPLCTFEALSEFQYAALMMSLVERNISYAEQIEKEEDRAPVIDRLEAQLSGILAS